MGALPRVSVWLRGMVSRAVSRKENCNISTLRETFRRIDRDWEGEVISSLFIVTTLISDRRFYYDTEYPLNIYLHIHYF